MKRKTWRERNPAEYNAAWQRWYCKNASRKIAWQQRRRVELRAWLHELKATLRCETCEESAPECLHFHHANPEEKELDVSTLLSNGSSKARILEELAKCHVLCANCHLKQHWRERSL